MVMEQIPASRPVSTCKGCGSFIRDQYILRVSPDLEWHAACLRCAECGRTLDDRCTCFVRNGKTYCKNDYVRLFGAKCNRCGQIFRARDMVMRAKDKIFHVDCFRCGVCTKRLVPGDEFALKDDSIFCREDFFCSKDSSKDDTDPLPSSPGCGEENVLVKVEKESRRREGKPTRVRTVLTEKQLHTLRTCYNANPRPDALMKEQMVEMTGLSPRVIRVWFQNKRCKDKKREIYLKQLQEQGKGGRFGGIGQVPAVPMVAGSPVRHGSPLPGQMVDVHAYQPPWKALTEFALQSDLEHMDPANSALQHLANQMHGYGLDTSAACSFPVETDLRYSTPDDMLADFPEHQSDISSHSD